MEALLSLVRRKMAGVGFDVETLQKIDGPPDIALILTCFVLWAFGLSIVKYSLQIFCHLCCSSIDASQARLPPPAWRQTPGALGEWGTTVKNASLNELETFLNFRKLTPKTDSQGTASRSELEQLATVEAVKYKSECLDLAVRTYNHETYTRGNKKWPYFVPQHSWNGWRGFWLELGGYAKNTVAGNIAYAFQHATSGVLCVYFLVTYDVLAYKLAVYLDLGFNMVDLLLMALSLAFDKDITFYSGCGHIFGASGVFKLLLMHHLGAAALELCILFLGSDLQDGVLACQMMLALVGTTGLMHFLCICSYMTPIREKPKINFVLHALTLALFVWYRAIYWVYLLWVCMSRVLQKGWLAGIVFVLSFGLFTLFNVDLIRHYLKVTRKTYANLSCEKQN